MPEPEYSIKGGTLSHAAQCHLVKNLCKDIFINYQSVDCWQIPNVFFFMEGTLDLPADPIYVIFKHLFWT